MNQKWYDTLYLKMTFGNYFFRFTGDTGIFFSASMDKSVKTWDTNNQIVCAAPVLVLWLGELIFYYNSISKSVMVTASARSLLLFPIAICNNN